MIMEYQYIAWKYLYHDKMLITNTNKYILILLSTNMKIYHDIIMMNDDIEFSYTASS